MTTTAHNPSHSRYVHGCPCDECRAAHAKYKRGKLWERMNERVLVDGRLVHPRAPHGTRSGYQNWGCRCVPCTRANTEAMAARRERLRGA